MASCDFSSTQTLCWKNGLIWTILVMYCPRLTFQAASTRSSGSLLEDHIRLQHQRVGFVVLFLDFVSFFLSLFPHKGSYALVSEIRFYGSQYAPTSPILCPGGTYQPLASQSKCLQCPANTWSAPNASHCTACAAERYSLPGSRTCLARSPCSPTTDYEPFFTPCTGVNSSRVQYWTMLDPVHCFQTDVEKVSFCAEIM